MDNRDEYEPLSVREGRAAPFGLTKGFPGYLRRSLATWFSDLALILRLDDGYESFEQFIDRKLRRSSRFSFDNFADPNYPVQDAELLDVIDSLLFHLTPLLKERYAGHLGWSLFEHLSRILADVNHEYRVDRDAKCLLKRVDETVWASYERARSADDEASKWIASAWAKSYSRDRDPSGAWSDARKAVEAALKPIVSPEHKRATISSMLREIRQAEHKWECDLRGSDNESAVMQFARSLEVIGYPGDHHGGVNGSVESEVSRTAVLQAVAVVGWLRDGAFRRVGSPEIPGTYG